ncbi:hypothetical protein CKF54_01340 [Psittacicella hinzii]|uniref:Multidrug resistance protein MdtA-like alpha-helical hairpin domain-containing protein n=1 Tax=Psittacicella hinzii TaxID=2028575 RepID=A0A3A1YD87_9GAMM|nr:HlyD family efflux transporter periplasmic adaptor subunit [Psittacicella hinzii]RIY34107.1 hypothetical protein CKF54_01340 [Psittacicella hinzii]
MKKGLLISLVALCVIGGGAATYFYKHSTDLPAYVVSSNSRVTVERYDVASLYAGKVETVEVSEGQFVDKDQILVTVSSDQARARLSAAQAALESAKNNLEASKSQVVSAQQALDVAQLDFNNAKSLRKQNLISATEYSQRQANFNSAQAQLEAAQATVNVAQAQISQAQATVNEAQSTLNDLAVKAPISGRVEYKLVNPGIVIGNGGRVVSLLDPSDVYVNVFLTTDQVNNLSINNEARVVIDGLDAVFPAKVTYIDSSAQFTPKSVETKEERTKLVFKVKLQVDKDVALRYKNYFRNGITTMGYVKLNNGGQWPSSLQIKLPE